MIILLAIACKPGNKPNVSQLDLPILGERYVDDNQDTVYHRIADFSLVNQLGDTITNSDVSGKVYVADFFFTSKPWRSPMV